MEYKQILKCIRVGDNVELHIANLENELNNGMNVDQEEVNVAIYDGRRIQALRKISIALTSIKEGFDSKKYLKIIQNELESGLISQEEYISAVSTFWNSLREQK